MKFVEKNDGSLYVGINYVDGVYGSVCAGEREAEWGTGEYSDPVHAVVAAAYTAGVIHGSEAAFKILKAFHEREKEDGFPNLHAKLIR